MTEDLYRAYRVLDTSGAEDQAARLFAGRYLVPLLSDRRADDLFEIGAGTGSTLRALRAAGFVRATGVDGSASQVEQARRLGTEVELGDGAATLAARPSGSLGAILLLDVLEHLTVEQLLAVLELAGDRLRPGGLLVARVPNGEGIFGGAIRYGDVTHLRAFTQRSLRQVFALRGLETVAVTPVRPVVHGPASAARAVLWAVVELAFKAAHAAESGRTDVLLTRNVLGVARRRP